MFRFRGKEATLTADGYENIDLSVFVRGSLLVLQGSPYLSSSTSDSTDEDTSALGTVQLLLVLAEEVGATTSDPGLHWQGGYMDELEASNDFNDDGLVGGCGVG